MSDKEVPSIARKLDIADFIWAIGELRSACEAIGVRAPSSITWRTDREVNLIGDALVKLVEAGHTDAIAKIRVLEGGRVEIEGIALKVTF